MTINKLVVILSLILLCLFACLRLETKANVEEFQIVRDNTSFMSYQVEIASSESTRKRGLMYRKIMLPNHGMLLDYKRAAKMAIWMKNTYIPLDIIFIDMQGEITKIHEGAVPHSTERIASGGKIRAVLEINAGQVEEHGIKVGDEIRHRYFDN
jgi:uncharacterized protein